MPSSPLASSRSLLFFNRSYYPDSEATGQLLTELCEDLVAMGQDVSVICGHPNANPSGVTFKKVGRETIKGVTVHRVWHTRFPKTSLIGRLCNLVTFTISATLAGLFHRRPAVVITETDPPFLCLVGRLLKWRFGCRHVCYLQDIHPELGLALKKIRRTRVTRFLRAQFHRAYRNADQIIVLSRDMARYLLRTGLSPERIAIIPNWVDTNRITPIKHHNPFRSQLLSSSSPSSLASSLSPLALCYSGNLGVCQDLDTILAAAELLLPETHIQFHLIGEGVSKARLIAETQRRNLTNVHFHPYQPLERLAESLSAADLHLVPCDRRAIRYLMPSKLYGILASGTPLIAIAPRSSELAQLVEQHHIGASVPPGDPQALADQIQWFANWCPDLAPYGERARALAESEYSRPHATSSFAAAILGQQHQPTPTLQTPTRELLASRL